MGYQNIFKRVEKKYLITKEEKEIIIDKMSEFMREDEYGRSTVFSLYFDTKDRRLIRRSIEKPIYKEKLRVRSYGLANPDSTVFIEIKKKLDSVVYKRRISMSEEKAMNFLLYAEEDIVSSQISREIDYFFKFYEGLEPSMILSYEREAFYSRTDMNFRVSFDENPLWRDSDLSLCDGAYGYDILPRDMSIMEIKTALSMPMWMTEILSEMKIYPTSFSKYGKAYQMSQKMRIKENNYALGGRKNA